MLIQSFKGLINVAPTKNSDQLSAIIKRMFWESPQTSLGWFLIIFFLIRNKIDDLCFYEEVTLVELKPSSAKSQGFCLGCYIFSERIIPSPSDELFVHEFGHFLQSKAYGIGYCFQIAIPSVWSFYFNSYHVHQQQTFEKDANRRSLYFFNGKDDFNKISFLKHFPV